MGKANKGERRPMMKHEIDEFNNPYREDLRSWKIRRPAAG